MVLKTDEFFKIEGSGNDFVTFIDIDGNVTRDEIPSLAVKLCDRNKGVGGDGIIIVQKSTKADFRMIYYNSDGSFAPLCGNGLRALGLLLNREKLIAEKMRIETDAGIFDLEVKGENSVRNSFNPAQIIEKSKSVNHNGTIFSGDYVNVGIPFFCVHMKSEEELSKLDVDQTGAVIRNHPDFGSGGTNVTFVCGKDRQTIAARIFERGIEGETLSSGTGSYSSAVSAVIQGIAEPPVKVVLPGGSILVGFEYKDGRIENPWLEGPASIVFKGKLMDL